MTEPIASFSGLASGIQWRDMVDQIMSIESARRYAPVANRQTLLRSQGEAWTQFQGIAAKFRDAARALQQTSAFDVFRTSVTRPASGRELVTVTAATGAQPGNYAVEVLATARAEKLSGAVATDATTALGVAGAFAVNGRTVTVVAEDTLSSLRDKITTANAGAGATGVTATILSAGGGARLVLTAQSTGAAGISLTDDGAGTLATLGLTDGTTVGNIGENGATRTQQLSSATATIATVLGVPLPTPSTIRVGGQVIAVDLSVDSLTTIAAAITAATGDADAVRVRSETVGTATRSWIETDLMVEVDGADAVNSARTLAVLGFTKEGRGDITQVVAGTHAYTDQGTGLAATGATLLSALAVNGQPLTVSDGDSITIGGLRGDGTTVQHTIAVTAGTTLQDLLTAIGDGTTGFGAGTRPAAASLVDGRITMTDSASGDSALALSLTLVRSGGGTASLGAFSTSAGVVGRNRVITAGADALLRLDGQLVRRSTNTITDALAGTTISALAAEPGAITTVQVTRDADAMVKTLQDFAAAYNAVRSWATANSAAGGALANNSALRTMAGTLTAQLLQPITGVAGTMTSAALAGLQHDGKGVLSLDTAVFKAAMASDLEGVRALFSQSGRTTDIEVAFITGGETSAPTATGYAVEITQVATQAASTGSAFTTYATTGTPDTMTLTDASTGRISAIQLANGDDIGTIVQRLNSSFATDGLRLSAERTVDDRIRIVSTDYGTEGGFTVAYAAGTGGDGTAMLGIAAGAHAGLDVGGTINGAAATGKGQILTGGSADASAGIALRYTGALARSAGTVTFALGVGGTLARAAQTLASDSSGAALQVTAATTQADALDLRLDDIQKRLDARREALIRQFVAMEGALAKSQALGAALTAQLNAMRPSDQN